LLAKVYIEVTNFCGLSCSFCEPPKSKPLQMELSLFEKINSELQGKTKSLAYHLLGDPLTLLNLKSYLDISQAYSHSVELTTSGFYLKDFDQNLLLHPAIKQINFSLSSYFANTKKIESLEAYMGRIIGFCKFSAQNPKRFINLRLWNMGDERYQEFNARIESILTKEFGVLDFSANKTRVAPYTILVKDKIFSWPSSAKSVVSESGSCLAISSQLAFLTNGFVAPCCLDTQADMKLGDINEQSLDEILDSQKAKNMREGFKRGELVEMMCKTCGFREIRVDLRS